MKHIFCILLLAAGPAVADGQRLVASCAACHGTNGVGKGSALPQLAGQPKERLVASLRAFKDGSRPNTIMQQIAKGYSEAQIEQMAAWLAAAPK
jgi:cytochrome c553